MMIRRSVVVLLVLGVIPGFWLPKSLHAQNSPRVLPGDDLPDLMAPDEIDTPEELPMGDALPEGPFSGQESSLPVQLGGPEFNHPTASEPAPLDPDFVDPVEIDRESELSSEVIGIGDPDEIPHEVIQERNAAGQVIVERGVAQDENENYVNHGPWRMWDAEGNLIAEGEFRMGQRSGDWARWYQPTDAGIFAAPPFSMFSPPFLSKASFDNGEIDGRWTISDQHDRLICEWSFLAGQRHGKSTWWYPNETRMRELTYDYGNLEGELIEWDSNGDVRTRVEYQDGRRWEKTTTLYKNGQKQMEGMVLRARLILKTPDDWWEAKLAGYRREGQDEKHGEWTAWYPNGQIKFTGKYQNNRPAGDFSWWYANGQKSLEGSYDAGEKTGKWIWWHESGLKSIEGRYLTGSPVERWIWWNEGGRVHQRINFSEAEPIYSQPVTTPNTIPKKTAQGLPHRRSMNIRSKPR